MTGADALPVLAGMLGGLAVFLFGIETLTDSLRAAAGDRLRSLLGRVTRTPLSGLASGAVFTGLVQSSSVTTVLLVSLVSAGLVSFRNSVAVIMGANIGSTVTAQIIALRVSDLALPMAAAGFAVAALARRDALRHAGRGVLALGLLFLGMGYMGAAAAPLRSEEAVLGLLARLDDPALGVLAGAVLTAAIQSSAATTGIVIALVSGGVLGLEAAIAVSLGANVGTCATALLAAIGKPVEAVRVAVAHVLFNAAGVCAWAFFVPETAWLVARTSADAARQVANAHTAFNVVNAAVLVWFCGPIARLVARLVPSAPMRRAASALDDGLLGTPALAMAAARREVGALGEVVSGMAEAASVAVASGDRHGVERARRGEAEANRLHAEIVSYLQRAGMREMGGREAKAMRAVLEAATLIEAVGDVVDRDLGRLSARWAGGAADEVRAQAVRAFRAACEAFAREDAPSAAAVLAGQARFDGAVEEAGRAAAARLVGPAASPVEAFGREAEFVEAMRRVHDAAVRLAAATAPGGAAD